MGHQAIDLKDLDADPGDDRLVYVGTDGDDDFSIDGLGVVQRTGHVSVNASDLGSVTLQLLNGNDLATVAASSLFAGGVLVEASTSDTAGDAVIVTGRTGVSTVLDLAASTVTGVVGGTVTLTGVEDLTINDDGGSDTININEVGRGQQLEASNRFR